MQQLPWWQFQKFVDRYRGDYKIKTFRYAEHFLVVAFAQLTSRESLRDIGACLRAMGPKLCHMGIRSKVSRNNLSNANENRDWRNPDYREFYRSHLPFLYAPAKSSDSASGREASRGSLAEIASWIDSTNFYDTYDGPNTHCTTTRESARVRAAHVVVLDAFVEPKPGTDSSSQL